MYWGNLLLLLTGLFGAGASFYLLRTTQRSKFMALFWASFVFVFIELSLLLDVLTASSTAEFIISQVAEWGHVYCLTLILGALLLFIRESKPEFSKFPRFYAILPVILIISYLLVYDTVVIKQSLLQLAKAGAAVVAVIIYGMYTYYEKIYITVFLGSLMILTTWLLHLFLPETSYIIWQVGLALSIITIFSGYLLVDRHYTNF